MKVLIESISSILDEELQNKPDYVTEERWEKVTRIRPLEDKKRSLLVGRLLQQMCIECGIKEPVYGTLENGKPVLINQPNLAFSISHSGEYAVLAYERDVAAIGVDIQQIRNISEGVKKRILHEKEQWIEKMPVASEKNSNKEQAVGNVSSIQNLHINRIWAIKESYVKMTGEGLSHDFRKLCIDFEKKVIRDENGRCASFLEAEAPEGYVLAVTVEAPEGYALAVTVEAPEGYAPAALVE